MNGESASDWRIRLEGLQLRNVVSADGLQDISEIRVLIHNITKSLPATDMLSSM